MAHPTCQVLELTNAAGCDIKARQLHACTTAWICADLIPEDCQPFLKGELEPVPAGHAVPSPVMEVFVANHALDAGKVHVCGSLWRCQHQAAVEDVQGLVLHGTHVEVIHSNYVE